MEGGPGLNLGAPGLALRPGFRLLGVRRVALDKDEGFVKAQIACALREHRLSRQRG